MRLNVGCADISLRRNGATVSLFVAALVCFGEPPSMLGSGLRLAARAALPWGGPAARLLVGWV